MKIFKPQSVGLLTRPFEFRRQFWLGLATLSFLPTGNDSVLLPETAMWPFLAKELPSDQPIDAAIPKSRAEFVAIAQAYSPRGEPAEHIEVGVQIGPLTKKLSVFGDRRFSGSLLGKAAAFTIMDIGWKRAYGGSGFAANPLGKGGVPIDGTDGQVFAAPNVVDPTRPEDALRSPAGFAPVDATWLARARLVGTYDDSWLKQDFPGFARDIDWRHFNIAPPDQWLPGGLLGDETYAFKNLHPTQPLLQGRLPGIAPRLFLVRKAQQESSFEEVDLALTTVWCFPHRERLVLVHHGRAPLAEEDGTDIARIVVGADRLGALRPAAAFRAVMAKRLDRNFGAIHSLQDDDLVPADLSRPDPALTATEEQAAVNRLMRKRTRNRVEREHADKREVVRQRGLDPDKVLAPLPPEPAIPTLAELPGIIAAARADADRQQETAQADITARKVELAAQMAKAGLSEAEIRQRLDAKAKGPPKFSAAAIREELAKQATAMRLLGQVTLGLEAQLASPEFIAQLQHAEAASRGGYRLSAHLQDPADGSAANRSAEIRRLLSTDSKAARLLYDLSGADLSGLDLAGVDLSGVCLDGANLVSTSLARANLANAVLAHAHMDGCVLDDADLSGANLGRASLVGASLRNAHLRKAILTGANLTDATFENADLEGVDLGNAVIAEGTNFSRVRAPNLIAIKLSLRGLHAPGIVLTKAQFIECDLEGADLSGASMDQVTFIKSNLAGLRCHGARMRKAVFVEQSSLVGAEFAMSDLTGANLRKESLPGVDFDGAIVEDADLSGADLTGAVLTRVRGAKSRWVAATLRHANMAGADLSHADLARTDLRGADLTGVSVYEANLSRARTDRDTARRGMLRTRMRYLPLAEPEDTA